MASPATTETSAIGDADIAAVSALLAEPARARILMALGDGRALPATTLASEAGVAASTASAHLGRLLDGGLITVLAQGRHRYYRLAGPHVGHLLETLASLAPHSPVRSLRDGTRAQALRTARTCYDHLAGRLGVELMAALIAQRDITGGDGRHRIDGEGHDRFSAPGRDLDYRLTPRGHERLTVLGVELPEPAADGSVPLRYCVDWTEQRHHLSGAAGAALSRRLAQLDWIRPAPRSRALIVTDHGRRGLAARLGVHAW